MKDWKKAFKVVHGVFRHNKRPHLSTVWSSYIKMETEGVEPSSRNIAT